jgi:hypothetical protein
MAGTECGRTMPRDFNIWRMIRGLIDGLICIKRACLPLSTQGRSTMPNLPACHAEYESFYDV